MKRFEVIIRWRSYCWTLYGLARSSADLAVGLMPYAPPDARVVVRRA